MPLILNLLDSSHVVMILSELLLVAQAVVPVTQLLISGRMTISISKMYEMRTTLKTNLKG